MASPQVGKTKTQLQHHLPLHSICAICITSHHAPSQKIWSSPHLEWCCTTLFTTHFVAPFESLQRARALGIREGMDSGSLRRFGLLHRIFTHRHLRLPRSGLGLSSWDNPPSLEFLQVWPLACMSPMVSHGLYQIMSPSWKIRACRKRCLALGMIKVLFAEAVWKLLSCKPRAKIEQHALQRKLRPKWNLRP